MTHTAITRPIIAACVAAAFLAGGPAGASGLPQHTDTATLKYYPSALSTQAGRAETFAQLKRSVDRTCNRYRTGKLSDMREMRACRDELTAALLQEIGDPRLSSLHAKSGGRIARRGE